MRKILFFSALLVLFNVSVKAQRDFGLTGGTFYYLGDINPTKQFYSYEWGGGAFFRHNLDSRYSMNINARYGHISGNDLDFDNVFQQARAGQFRLRIIDISWLMEFNFFPLRLTNGYIASPYVTAGPSLVILPQSAIGRGIQGSLAFGGGVKWNIIDNLGVSVDWNFRKLFYDNIDQLPEHLDSRDGYDEAKFMLQTNTTDLYSYAGLSLYLRFWEKDKHCPAYRDNRLNRE